MDEDYSFAYFLLGGFIFMGIESFISNHFEKKQGWCRLCGPNCKRRKRS
jgi:hypothetical protein